MLIWYGGAAEAALLAAAPAPDDRVDLFGSQHIAPPRVRSLVICAAVAAFALTAAQANSLALHPPQDHSGVFDVTKTYSNAGPPLSALKRMPSASHVDGDLLSNFAVAADNTYPLQATNRGPAREFLRRMPQRTSGFNGDPTQPGSAPEVPQLGANRRALPPSVSRHRSVLSGDLLAVSSEVPQLGTNRTAPLKVPRQHSFSTGDLLSPSVAADDGIAWRPASNALAPKFLRREPKPRSYSTGDLLGPFTLEDTMAWQPGVPRYIARRHEPLIPSGYLGSLLDPESTVPPIPPVVLQPPDLGAYATDGRHGSKVRSRYFRPDAAYRYRRGRR